MLEVQNIVKTYGDVNAVNGISFKVEPGKIYGLLGKNGAGKSTTMNIMTGYIGATSGTVTIDGHDIFKEAGKAKKHIGYLPEIPPLYLDMTVEEYLRFVAELKGVPKKLRTDEVIDVLEKTQTSAVCQKLIRNLSKGYRQRVGLAQALIGNPEVIILDEPTVGLDPKQILEVRELIGSLREDHAVILSSHILSEIQETCDEVFIISQGKLVLQESMESLEADGRSLEEIFLQMTSDTYAELPEEVTATEDASEVTDGESDVTENVVETTEVSTEEKEAEEDAEDDSNI